jgi:NAD+ synthase
MITKENVKKEVEKRVSWIQSLLTQTGAKGIVVGNSGGKDSATVLALCKKATPHVLSVIMPCGNISEDEEYAWEVAKTFDIETVKIDLMETFQTLSNTINTNMNNLVLEGLALSNMKPRLRMTTLYAIGQTKGYLVAGTGNKSEATMGYFTKWGDGAHDFNVIADLTVSEVRTMGEYLGVPAGILQKPPSAGLWKGQTDEEEMGVLYREIDEYLLTGKTNPKAQSIIEQKFVQTAHKRAMPLVYPTT